jgi:GTP cyclohydrolase I
MVRLLGDLPRNRVVGISKPARIVELYASACKFRSE